MRLLRPTGRGWHEERGGNFVIHVDAPGDARLAFAAAVARGMEARPRRLEPRFIYDAAGSEIYEEITVLPEYYQTRTEDGILASCAAELAAAVGPTILVELGSGSSTKTRRLIEAWRAASFGLTAYVPVDVSVTAVSGACDDLLARYPGLRVEGVASTFQRGLMLTRELSPKTLVFLGSTLGNFEPDEVDAFFRQVSESMEAGDHFLLGIDLAKDRATLEAAYGDSAGVTERFILNVFTRMNREIAAGVDVDAFEMQSFYDMEKRRVEMWAHVKAPQTLHVAPLGRSFELSRGERILVEVSRKFTLDQLREEASRFGLQVRQVHTDPKHHFAVALLQRGVASTSWRATLATNAPAPRRPEVPPVGQWRQIPAGPALLGEPLTSQDVASLQLGATPVTNGELRAFVAEGGYLDEQWWSEEGRAWRKAANAAAPLGWERTVDDGWQIQGFPLDYLEPVTGVCFWEAEAYANWAGARIPSEQEWEKGAAWDPEHGRQRTWPWGELPPDPRRANAGGVLPGPVAVGSYPASVSFYGLHQVLGDVWEWVRGEEGPVLRGGSFQTALPELTCALRRSASAVHRVPTVGFRLARSN